MSNGTTVECCNSARHASADSRVRALPRHSTIDSQTVRQLVRNPEQCHAALVRARAGLLAAVVHRHLADVSDALFVLRLDQCEFVGPPLLGVLLGLLEQLTQPGL